MRILRRMRIAVIILRWWRSGKPSPPPHEVKELVVRAYATRFRRRILLETGTYLGDMVEAMRHRFDRIISIEVDTSLAVQAKLRFRGEDHIEIVCGDSGVAMPEMLAGMKGEGIFWLDGHYSGGITSKGSQETPVGSELRHIFAHGKKPVILIDDARLFNGENDYPSLADIQSLTSSFSPEYICEAKNDIIRIYPRPNGHRLVWWHF